MSQQVALDQHLRYIAGKCRVHARGNQQVRGAGPQRHRFVARHHQ
jgi:hypothetical protein